MLKTIRFRADLPYYLEIRLQNKDHGFHVQTRVFKESITFGKNTQSKETLAPTGEAYAKEETMADILIKQSQLPPPARRLELERRCDNIVCFYPDPYNCTRAIRVRLTMMQQKMCQADKNFIQQYMDENFPEEQEKAA